MARANYHFSKAFNDWFNAFVKHYGLKRENFVKEQPDYTFNLQGVYDAFKAGQESPKTSKFEKEFRAIQKKMKAAYEKGDIKALDELTEEVIFL